MFPQKGELDTMLNQVDPRTGTLEVQARFPNPDRQLLPGQFGRVRFQTEERKNAILVPQRAVQQVQNHSDRLHGRRRQQSVEARAVKTGARVGEDWIIEQGLQPGDQVIVEGQLRIRPGSPVHPKPCSRRARRAVRKPWLDFLSIVRYSRWSSRS